MTNAEKALQLHKEWNGKFETTPKMSITVDEVKEVVTLGEESIEKPNVSDAADPMVQYLSGIGKHGDGLVSLLNIASVIIEKENV